MPKQRKRNRLKKMKQNRAHRRIPADDVLSGKVKIGDPARDTARELVHAAIKLHAAEGSSSAELDSFLIQAIADKILDIANEVSPEVAVGILVAEHGRKRINLPIEFSAKEIGLSPSDYELFIGELENRVSQDETMKGALELLTSQKAKAVELSPAELLKLN